MKITLVSPDLMARGRLEPAATGAGAELDTVRVDRLLERLRREVPDILVLDLDAGGRDLLAVLETARSKRLLPGRVIGYFSHVDEDLGRAAAAAGIDAFPRGRFWRDVQTLLRPGTPDSSL